MSAAATPAATAAPAAAPAAAASDKKTAAAPADQTKAGSIATTGASVSSKDAKDVKGGGAGDQPAKEMIEKKKALLTTEKEDDDKDWDAAISNYTAAPRMSVVDIMAKDVGDASLQKYKKQLLGEAATATAAGAPIAARPADPRHCIVDSITLIFAGQKPFVLNPEDKTLKSKPLILKENSAFKTVIKFYIQHEIVAGLRYQNKIYKHHFKVDTRQDMLGSFAPQSKAYEITMPEDTTPSGWSGRGSYTAKCKIVDDDKTKHAAFEYAFEIKSDWE